MSGPGPAPLLVIAGPTASGKSALGLEVAKACGGEIVNADSQQVYRHFDIGTAKPTAEELAQVPHHLLSIAEPHEQFSAARFQTLADEAIALIRARGRRPVIVGGTGLYLRFLLQGVMPAPPADLSLRARLEREADALGRPALHARLSEVDPDSAARIGPSDLVRIVRALELYELTGTPASALRDQHAFREARHPFVLFVLDPPRDALYRAIDARAQAMFDGGLPEEVKALLARGHADAPPMRSVGYVQARDFVEGRLSREEAIRKAAQQTRHYAKRQLTWFRKEPSARFLTPPYDVSALCQKAGEAAQASAGMP